MQKFREYLRRTEEIRAVIDEGGAGPPPNGGDAAVAAKPKTKPKDGKDGEDPEQAKLRAGLNSAIVREKPNNVKWNNVAGLESAKQSSQEAVILSVKFPQFLVIQLSITLVLCRVWLCGGAAVRGLFEN